MVLIVLVPEFSNLLCLSCKKNITDARCLSFSLLKVDVCFVCAELTSLLQVCQQNKVQIFL